MLSVAEDNALKLKIRQPLGSLILIPKSRLSYQRAGSNKIPRSSLIGSGGGYQSPQSGVSVNFNVGGGGGGVQTVQMAAQSPAQARQMILRCSYLADAAPPTSIAQNAISDQIPFPGRIKSITIGGIGQHTIRDGVRLFAFEGEAIPSTPPPSGAIELVYGYHTVTSEWGSDTYTDADKRWLPFAPAGNGVQSISADIFIPWQNWRLALYYKITTPIAEGVYTAYAIIEVVEDIMARVSGGGVPEYAAPAQVPGGGGGGAGGGGSVPGTGPNYYTWTEYKSLDTIDPARLPVGMQYPYSEFVAKTPLLTELERMNQWGSMVYPVFDRFL